MAKEEGELTLSSSCSSDLCRVVVVAEVLAVSEELVEVVVVRFLEWLSQSSGPEEKERRERKEEGRAHQLDQLAFLLVAPTVSFPLFLFPLHHGCIETSDLQDVQEPQ